jgi:hypothetical protein
VDLEAALRAAVLEEDVAILPEGLDTLVGPRGVRLSGGQAQRAAAARMFARTPELLVFDDLSSALDVETERTLWERVFERREAKCWSSRNRRPALRRADHNHRPQRWPDRSGGQAGRVARNVRGNAAVMAWRRWRWRSGTSGVTAHCKYK